MTASTILKVMGKLSMIFVFLAICLVNKGQARNLPVHSPDHAAEMAKEDLNPTTQLSGFNHLRFHRPARNAEEKKKLCGNRLFETIRMTCRSRSHGGYSERSSHVMDILNSPKPNSRESRRVERNINEELHSHDLGVMHECCVKSCSIRDLRKYCTVPPPVKTTTTTTTTVAPAIESSSFRERRRPRKGSKKRSRKQQRKRNRVRITLPEEDPMGNNENTRTMNNDLKNALQCILDENCNALNKNGLSNIAPASTLPNETNTACSRGQRRKGDRRRGGSSKHNKVGM